MKAIAAVIFCIVCVEMSGALKMSLQRGFTEVEKQYLLDYHDEIRAKVARGEGQGGQPKAAAMFAMFWNDDLARNAQSHADDCEGAPHDPKDARKQGTPFGAVGQNMQQCTKGRDDCIDEAMWRFYDEAMGYTYSSGACTKPMCTHYTQLVWADSRYVGCGYNWCPQSTFARIVCNYGPGGNYVNEKPYIEGETCSKCPSSTPECMGGLCVAHKNCSNSDNPDSCRCAGSAAICASNGGTFDHVSCNCKCPEKRVGLNCEKTCVDQYPAHACVGYRDQYSFCQPKSLYYNLMKAYCPYTCKLCDNVPSFPHKNSFKVNPRRKSTK